MAAFTISPGTVCLTCKEDLTKNGWQAGPVVHCPGSRLAALNWIRPDHHGRVAWKCSECGGYLGCNKCAGNYPDTILCRKCNRYADGYREGRHGGGQIEAHVRENLTRLFIALPFMRNEYVRRYADLRKDFAAALRRPANFLAGMDQSMPTEERREVS